MQSARPRLDVEIGYDARHGRNLSAKQSLGSQELGVLCCSDLLPLAGIPLASRYICSRYRPSMDEFIPEQPKYKLFSVPSPTLHLDEVPPQVARYL